jgi:hypothetical protein
MRHSRSRWSASAITKSRVPEALGANVGGDLLEPRDELGRRVAGEQPGKGRVELFGGRCEHPTRARDPGARLLSGSDPFQPA